MRVLLINPSILDILPNKEYIPPSSLLYLGAVLVRHGVEVEILDLNIYKPWQKNLGSEQFNEEDVVLQHISTFKPLLIGFGCLFSGQFSAILKYSERIRREFEKIPIVIGGMHPTLFAKEIIQHCPSIDYVVIGEGEEQIVNLIEVITQGNMDYLSHCNGIAYRKDGQVIVQPKTHYIKNLDELPFPAYELIDFKNYSHSTSHWHNPKNLVFNMSVPLISSRSCPNRCNFCSMFLVMGPKIRIRSPQNVVDEIQLLHDRFGHTHFSFMDDNINLIQGHIISICNEIIRRKLDIQFETPNGLSINPLNREVTDAMVNAGWVRGAIAIESGSDFIRNKVMGKHLQREKIMEVVQLLKGYEELYVKAYFIIGMPEETPHTLTETYEMIKEIDLDEIYVTNLMPFPGTPVFEQAKRDHLFVDEIDIPNIWKMTGFHYHNNKRFYIKPYEMGIEELNMFREKFDHLLMDLKKEKKIR
ncbi:MAG: B12-binding domain-containing radical SAM protein [bacterium]